MRFRHTAGLGALGPVGTGHLMKEREDTSWPPEDSKTGRVVAGGILPWLFLTRREEYPAIASCRERHAHTAVVGLFTPGIPQEGLGLGFPPSAQVQLFEEGLPFAHVGLSCLSHNGSPFGRHMGRNSMIYRQDPSGDPPRQVKQDRS